MIGRERERDVVRRAVARAGTGGASFLLVAGEPGIGKTTLLRELSDLATNAGLTVGHGRGEPEGAVPLRPWTSALGTIANQHSVPVPDGGPSRFAVFERFGAELSARASEGPVALVVDDLQWADLSALRLFAHLLDRPPLPGVLVAAGLRTTAPLADDAAEVVSGLLAHPSMEVVEMSAFGEREIAAFADERLARRPSDDEIAVLARRSGGNPFFLGELLRWIPTDGSSLDLDAALPLAVRESVRRRLVVENTVAQEVVKAAAVAGSVASLDLLAKIDGVDRIEVGEALDSAERAGLLAVGSDGSVTFVHDLVREAVLSLLSTWSRIELHHAVGTALRGDAPSLELGGCGGSPVGGATARGRRDVGGREEAGGGRSDPRRGVRRSGRPPRRRARTDRIGGRHCGTGRAPVGTRPGSVGSRAGRGIHRRARRGRGVGETHRRQ